MSPLWIKFGLVFWKRFRIRSQLLQPLCHGILRFQHLLLKIFIFSSKLFGFIQKVFWIFSGSAIFCRRSVFLQLCSKVSKDFWRKHLHFLGVFKEKIFNCCSFLKNYSKLLWVGPKSFYYAVNNSEIFWVSKPKKNAGIDSGWIFKGPIIFKKFQF